MLRRWKREQSEASLKTGQPRSDRVFPWRPEDVSAAFRKAAWDARLPRLRFHDLRHTAASLMLGAGIPVHIVAARLGHSTPVTTWAVYSHLQGGEDRHAGETLANLTFGNQSGNADRR